jgi:hypothetical protein
VNPIQFVIGDDHEKWEKGLPDGKQVVVGWLPFKEEEGVMGLFEEASECLGHHFSLLGFRRQMGAVKDCNYDNEGNHIGKGELRVLGAFGDLSEFVEAPMALVDLTIFLCPIQT